MNDSQKHLYFLQELMAKLPDELATALRQRRAENLSDYNASARSSGEPYKDVIATAWEHARTHSARFRHALMRSDITVEQLLELDPEQRARYLRDCPDLHSPTVVTMLLRWSRDQRSVNPSESEEIAQLALGLVELVDASPNEEGISRLLADLRSRAWGQIGNARRIQSDLRGADQALKQAQLHLTDGSQDPLERALIDHSVGRLRIDQRRFDEAIPPLTRACRLYRAVRDEDGRARALISLACAHREAGDSESALSIICRAEALLPQDSPFVLHIRHNKIYWLIDLGRYVEAERMLDATRSLYAHASEPLVRLRLPWVEGRLAKSTDQLDEAEYLFQKVRRGFIDHGIAYDAALVSLELAEIYVQQGRTNELKELAHEMVTVFRSRNVERETLAALLMLQHAASAERASLHVVRDIAARLRQRTPQALTPLSSEDG